MSALHWIGAYLLIGGLIDLLTFEDDPAESMRIVFGWPIWIVRRWRFRCL